MDSTSILSLAKKIVEHGLEVSPTTGNGFGWAIGFSAFFAFAFAFALWRKDRAWAKERSELTAAHAAERDELTSGFIDYLKRLNTAQARRAERGGD